MSSPLPPDPYDVLGVSKDAQIPEIRSAHRKLVLKCHPDKVQDPALKAEKQNEFQRVQQAYEILSDETERAKYDNQVKVTELRRQYAQQKANSSATRSSRSATAEYEVNYASPRPSHRSSPSTATPPKFKVYYSSKSYDSDEGRRGARIYDAEPRAPPTRRESSFAERDSRPSKREAEREREREKERERQMDRDRKKRLDRDAKEAKEAKEVRRAEKKAKEKQLAKEMRREAEDKRRHMTPDDDLPPPRMDKKSSSTRKHEPREPSLERERNFGYDEFGADAKARYAESYINAARVSAGGAPRRSKTYHGRTPYVPSPPPAPGVASAYPSPDEDEPRRSAASARRRGSADVPSIPRERTYNKSSRERLDEEPVILETRPTATFQKSMSSASAPQGLSSSPPRPARTNTMPAEHTFTRPVPGMTRAKTFTEGAPPRGRTRSKMEPQVEVDSEDEDVYEQERERDRRARERESREARDSRDAYDRKHRSSRKNRSPERYREEAPRTVQKSFTYTLNNDNGGPRTKLARSYTRPLDEAELYESYGTGARYVERPSLGVRESSYSSSNYGATPMTKFPKVRTTKLDDVKYSPAYAV